MLTHNLTKFGEIFHTVSLLNGSLFVCRGSDAIIQALFKNAVEGNAVFWSFIIVVNYFLIGYIFYVFTRISYKIDYAFVLI